MIKLILLLFIFLTSVTRVKTEKLNAFEKEKFEKILIFRKKIQNETKDKFWIFLLKILAISLFLSFFLVFIIKTNLFNLTEKSIYKLTFFKDCIFAPIFVCSSLMACIYTLFFLVKHYNNILKISNEKSETQIKIKEIIKEELRENFSSQTMNQEEKHEYFNQVLKTFVQEFIFNNEIIIFGAYDIVFEVLKELETQDAIDYEKIKTYFKESCEEYKKQYILNMYKGPYEHKAKQLFNKNKGKTLKEMENIEEMKEIAKFFINERTAEYFEALDKYINDVFEKDDVIINFSY